MSSSCRCAGPCQHRTMHPRCSGSPPQAFQVQVLLPQEVVEYCLGCNPNMNYHYQDASRFAARLHSTCSHRRQPHCWGNDHARDQCQQFEECVKIFS